MKVHGRGLRIIIDLLGMVINRCTKKSQVVALPIVSENALPVEGSEDANQSQKALMDLEKTGTRYANGFNLNKDLTSPSKKRSVEIDNQLVYPNDRNNKQQDDKLQQTQRINMNDTQKVPFVNDNSPNKVQIYETPRDDKLVRFNESELKNGDDPTKYEGNANNNPDEEGDQYDLLKDNNTSKKKKKKGNIFEQVNNAPLLAQLSSINLNGTSLCIFGP